MDAPPKCRQQVLPVGISAFKFRFKTPNVDYREPVEITVSKRLSLLLLVLILFLAACDPFVGPDGKPAIARPSAGEVAACSALHGTSDATLWQIDNVPGTISACRAEQLWVRYERGL